MNIITKYVQMLEISETLGKASVSTTFDHSRQSQSQLIQIYQSQSVSVSTTQTIGSLKESRSPQP